MSGRSSAALLLRLRSVLALALALLAIALPALGAAPTQKDADMLSALVRYIDAGNEEMTTRLSELGYQPTIDPALWRGFPSIRKVETAYASAAKAGGDAEGRTLLAQLAHQVASGSEAAASDPRLKELLASPKPDIRVRFATLTLTPDQIRLDPATKAKIGAIVDYADGGILNGASGILQYEMDLDPRTAYEILRSARSNTEALIAGLQAAGIPPPHAIRLAEIATEIARQSEAAGADERLKAIVRDVVHMVDPEFLATTRSLFGDVAREAPAKAKIDQSLPTATIKQLRAIDPDGGSDWTPPPDKPSGMASVPPSTPGPGGGGRPGPAPAPNLKRSAERYRSFARDSYGPSMPLFRDAVRRIGGFGGVIFGASVASELGLPPPVSLHWQPFYPAHQASDAAGERRCGADRSCGAWGRLLVRFTDGRQAVSSVFRAEDVGAANCIAYGGCAGTAAADPGGAIPLAGLTDLRTDVAVKDGRLRVGSWFTTLVHPALDGTSLGRAAVALDGLPTEPMNGSVLQLAQAAGDDAAKAVERWLGDVSSTWKFTDVPMVVGLVGRRLTLRPATMDAKRPPQEMARASFIGFVAFPDDEDLDDRSDATAATEFAAAAGPLLRTITEVERLNEFAQVLGIVRWAKEQKAAFAGPPATAAPGETIGSATFNDGIVSVGPSSSPILHAENMRLAIESILLPAVPKLRPASRSIAARAISASREVYATRLLIEDARIRIEAAASKMKPSTRERLQRFVDSEAAIRTPARRGSEPRRGAPRTTAKRLAAGVSSSAELRAGLKSDGVSDAETTALLNQLGTLKALGERGQGQARAWQGLVTKLQASERGTGPDGGAALSTMLTGLLLLVDPDEANAL